MTWERPAAEEAEASSGGLGLGKLFSAAQGLEWTKLAWFVLFFTIPCFIVFLPFPSPCFPDFAFLAMFKAFSLTKIGLSLANPRFVDVFAVW